MKPDEPVYDALTDRYVAVNYARNPAIVFEKEGDRITVVTVIEGG